MAPLDWFRLPPEGVLCCAGGTVMLLDRLLAACLEVPVFLKVSQFYLILGLVRHADPHG